MLGQTRAEELVIRHKKLSASAEALAERIEDAEYDRDKALEKAERESSIIDDSAGCAIILRLCRMHSSREARERDY